MIHRTKYDSKIYIFIRDLSELPEVSLEIQDMSISQDLDDREKQELEKLLDPFRVHKSKES